MCGSSSQENPVTSPAPRVSMMMGPRPRVATSSLTLPSRIRKHRLACAPSRNRNRPAGNSTFAAQPASRVRYAGSRSPTNGWLRSSCSSVSTIPSLSGLSLYGPVAGADGGGLFGDVDADWAPGDAPATADAAGRAELVDPGGQLVRHPLPVT